MASIWSSRAFGGGAVLLSVLSDPPTASAQAVGGVQAAVTEPIAPRGGVLMVPLGARQPGRDWPATIQLSLADGRRIDGVVAWVHAAPPANPPRWTDDPRRLAVRGIEPGDDTARAGSGAAFLLARMPKDGRGGLRLNGQLLWPVWRDLPVGWREPPPEAAPLEIVAAPDRPDPESPFEYWRWMLLADRRNRPPPPLSGFDEVERLVAEHYADLWRIGLGRLASRSREVADQCRDVLTRTSRDGRQRFAAWVADPTQGGELLGGLLSFHRPEQDVLADAIAWAMSRDEILVWAEAGYGDQVRVALTNPASSPLIAKFTWLGGDNIPIAVRLEPETLARVNIDRPPLPGPSAIGLPRPEELPTQTLRVEAAGREHRLTFGRRTTIARPPGVYGPALGRPPTLGELQTGRPHLVPPTRATFAHFRKHRGRWEVFFECRRPEPDADEPARRLRALTSHLDARGVEAVTLLLGPEDEHVGPVVVLVVPEKGERRLLVGPGDPGLQVHRRSYADRWYCRIVLPRSWLSPGEDQPTLLGFARTHGDGEAFESGPGTTAPWRPGPGRIAVDLGHWDDRPR